jgi:sialic acid synthase SpsE
MAFEFPKVIAEIGINHEGHFEKALRMVKDACDAGCKCVKFQCHVIEDEMVPEAQKIVPGNAHESIWDIMKRCAFSETEEIHLKEYVEHLGMTYLCTPFSRAAADRLEKMGVNLYKIGSGECNNLPLIRHIANFKKPIILSTGMNDFDTIDRAVEAVGDCPLTLLHCTSMYPTPYTKVRLGAMLELSNRYGVPVGLSDHSIGIYTALAAVALGATTVEKHFTSDKSWPGPDISISITPEELRHLVIGFDAIRASLGGHKSILPGEQPTIKFAYACVVTTRPIHAGEVFSKENLWVKRPGNGEILAYEYDSLLGKTSACDIPPDIQLKRGMIQ